MNNFLKEIKKVFLIGEIGINHNGKMNLAKKLLLSAAKSGVDAVKFQTFKADEFISNKKKNYRYFSKGKWVNESMYDMFKRCELSEDCWYKIKKKCIPAAAALRPIHFKHTCQKQPMLPQVHLHTHSRGV